MKLRHKKDSREERFIKFFFSFMALKKDGEIFLNDEDDKNNWRHFYGFRSFVIHSLAYFYQIWNFIHDGKIKMMKFAKIVSESCRFFRFVEISLSSQQSLTRYSKMRWKMLKPKVSKTIQEKISTAMLMTSEEKTTTTKSFRLFHDLFYNFVCFFSIIYTFDHKVKHK